MRRDAPGLDDMIRIFGVKSSVFIQPGGSWAPQVPYAFTRLGVPLYADGIFESEPFWFCGSLCLNASMHLPELSTLDDLSSLRERFDELHAAKQGDGELIVVFSHPMFVTETFWDSVSFHGGRNPLLEEYVAPPLRSKQAREESLRVFEEFLEYIVGFPDMNVVTFRDVPNLYSEPKERVLTLDQIFLLAKEAANRSDWQILDGISVSPAETLRVLIEVIVQRLSSGVEPEHLPLRFTIGPTSKSAQLGVRRTLQMSNFLSLCFRAHELIEKYDMILSVPHADNILYGPNDLLEVASKAAVFYSKVKSLPEKFDQLLSGISNNMSIQALKPATQSTRLDYWKQVRGDDQKTETENPVKKVQFWRIETSSEGSGF